MRTARNGQRGTTNGYVLGVGLHSAALDCNVCGAQCVKRLPCSIPRRPVKRTSSAGLSTQLGLKNAWLNASEARRSAVVSRGGGMPSEFTPFRTSTHLYRGASHPESSPRLHIRP